jgi:hypothetical protein
MREIIFNILSPSHSLSSSAESKQRMEMAALNLLMGRRVPLAFTAGEIYR